MKNKIESKRSKYYRERSSSGSSHESKHVKREKYRTKKHYSEEKKYKKSKRSRSSSSSSSSSSSDSECSRNSSKRRNNMKKENEYANVRVKEEPISDDERLRKSYHYNSYEKNHQRRYDHDNERRQRRRSRSRSVNDSRPIKQERPSNSYYNKRLNKKENYEDKDMQWGKPSEIEASRKDKKPLVNKAKPDFGLSGKLTEETNTYNGVVIKYSEPPEARKPKRRWRLYPFKGDEGLPTMYIHRQSAYLIGRDRKVADFPVDHPSCSKQHAALQYRLVPFERANGTKGKRICPYLIDLESANGTFVNNKKIEPRKYVELMEKDVIKFAFSSREYVLLHEHSKDSEEDDNM